MRTNGTLSYCEPDITLNDDGEPVINSLSWSNDIPCLIRVVTNNSKGRYEDGKFNQASYEVLVESSDMPLDIKRVQLTHYGKSLGEFAIQGNPVPTSMHRIKITV